MKNFTQNRLFVLALLITTVFANQISAQRKALDNLIFSNTNINTETVSAPSAAFTAGNIVVCRVGSGATLGTASAEVLLDEYTPTGTLVQTIALPTTPTTSGNRALTVGGSSTTECQISLSPNGQFITLAGYNAAPGTAAIAGTPNNGSASDINRVLGRVDTNGTIDTTTALIGTAANPIYSGQNIRDAVISGTSFYSSGSGAPSLGYTVFGANTATQVTSGSIRAIEIFGGDLYFDTSTTISKFTGLPTGTATPTAFTGATFTNLNGFVFLDVDNNGSIETAYIADGNTLKKFAVSGSTLTAEGTATSVGSNTILGVTAKQVATGIQVFITTSSSIQTLTDTSGAGGTLATTFASIATPSVTATLTNTAFRGIALAPSITTAASATVGGRVTEANGRGIFRARVTLVDSQGIEQSAYTNTQGYYSFPDVPGGQTYIFTVRHLRYQFAVSSFVEFVDEDNPNINFVSVGESLRPANRLLDQ
jgi:hypothetical protein